MNRLLYTLALFLLSLNVFAQAPDLTVDITAAGPDPITTGDNLTVKYTVSNTGAGDAIAAIYVGFYLSEDAFLDEDDLGLGSDYDVIGLFAGESGNGTAFFSIPSGLAEGDKYIFAYVDYKYNITESKENNNSSSSSISIVKQGTGTAPAAPKNLSAEGDIRSVKLSWSANTESYFGYYELYRSTSNSPGTSRLVTTIAGTSTSYTDGNKTIGQAYYYWLKAVNLTDAKSGFSTVAFGIPIGNSVPPAAPTGLTATTAVNSIILKWNNNKETDLNTYYLYKSTLNMSNTATSAGFANVPDTTHTDVSYYSDPLEPGVDYYYWIRVENSSGIKSAFSEFAIGRSRKPDTLFQKAPAELPELNTEMNLRWDIDPTTRNNFRLSKFNRDPATSYTFMEQSHAAKVYEPISIHFWNKDQDFIAYNYSKCGFSLETSISNKYSKPLYVRFAAVDIKGVKIDITEGTDLATAYQGEIGIRIPAMGTKNVSFMFKGFEAIYTDQKLCDQFQDISSRFPCARTTFDYSKVTGIEVMVLGNNPELDEISLAGVSFSNIILRDYIGACALGLEESSEAATGLIVYPNPASQGTLTLNKTVIWLKIFNAQGILVKSASNTNTVDIENLTEGIYMLESNEGFTKFIRN